MNVVVMRGCTAQPRISCLASSRRLSTISRQLTPTMSHPSHGAIVIVGSGPGIGVHVVTKFASNGFKNVVLLARNKTRLEEEANAVRSAAGQDVKVHTVSTDLADGQSVEAGLKQIDQALGDVPLEAVLFNPARVGPSTFFEFAPEEFEQDLKVCLALYIPPGPH